MLRNMLSSFEITDVLLTDILEAIQEIRKSIGEIPILASEQVCPIVKLCYAVKLRIALVTSITFP